MIELLAILLQASQGQVVVPAGPEPSLLDRRWELVWTSEEGSAEWRSRAYIHPDSIRRATEKDTVFSVAVIVERTFDDEADNSRGVYSAGYLVDCSDRTVQTEWTISSYEGRPLMSYSHKPLSFEPHGQQIAVVERVCRDQ